MVGRGRTGTVRGILVRSNRGGLRASIDLVECFRNREALVLDMVGGLSTERIDSGTTIGKVVSGTTPFFDRGPNLALRFGLPKAAVNCFVGEVFAGNIDATGNGLIIDATAERGACDKRPV